MMRFSWGHEVKEKRIHWMSWSKLSLSKAKGGMGLRDLVNFNKALLAKQIWRLWKFSRSLIATIMKAKYYPDCSVLEAACGKETLLCMEEYTEFMVILLGMVMFGELAMEKRYAYGRIDGSTHRPLIRLSLPHDFLIQTQL
jgi:hypothetical protein